jgi:hypothetical protein
MLRHRSYTIALAVMLVGLSPAQAEDTVLMLACQGTRGYLKEPVSMSIIVNLTKGTLESSSLAFWGFSPINVTIVSETTVIFRGSVQGPLVDQTIDGSIDRVTGDLEATRQVTDPNADPNAPHLSYTYLLKCKPAQRMF